MRREAVAGPLSETARAHLGTCADCAAFVRARDALAGALPPILSAGPTPAELARGARRRRGRSRRPAAVAGAIVPIVAAALAWAWVWAAASPRRQAPSPAVPAVAARRADVPAHASSDRLATDGIPAFVNSVAPADTAAARAGWRRAEEPLAPYALLSDLGGEEK